MSKSYANLYLFLLAKARNELSAKTTVKMMGKKLNDFALYFLNAECKAMTPSS
jgi:hypothetical protein